MIEYETIQQSSTIKRVRQLCAARGVKCVIVGEKNVTGSNEKGINNH